MNNLIAIIPARQGSKGYKDKNIALLKDKPLLAYTIEAALKSNCFKTVMVSTDSAKYAEIAISFGAEVPFLRSSTNSCDKASSWDVVKEVIDYYKSIGMEYDEACLLQPTSPLRNEFHIKEAYKSFIDKNAIFLESVVETEC